MNTLIQTNAPAAAKPSVLCDGLIRLGFFCKEDAQGLAKKLKIYDGELQLFNSVYDLTAAKTEHERALHIFDCLAAVGKLRELKEKIRCERTVDKNAAKTNDFTGSGAGLPGIPLALAMSDTNFVLVERMSKRCVFLENCAAVLGLKNVRVVNTQLEHCGDRERQTQRRIVLAVLDGDDRLPRHPQGLAELRLGPAPVPAQAPHTIPHQRPP